MSQLFVIGDTHFGHRKIWSEFEHEARPFNSQDEHDEALIDRWNSVVKKRDVVWHLGDFAKEDCKNVSEVLQRLAGRIKMVLGNHDNGRAMEYQQGGVKLYGPTKLSGGVLLSHIPVHPSCLGHRFKVNVHGHTHSKRVQLREVGLIGEVIIKDDPRYINVSAEQNDLTPIPYETVRGWIRERGLSDG